jgi:hypothetical protein
MQQTTVARCPASAQLREISAFWAQDAAAADAQNDAQNSEETLLRQQLFQSGS